MAGRGGYILLVTALSLFAFIGLVGLATDVGWLYFNRRAAQVAADAASFGAIAELNLGHTTTVVSAAQGDAALNGFTNGVGGVTVAVNNPPQSGNYLGQNMSVEVIVSKTVPLLFLQGLGFASTPVSARSVSREGDSPNCVYVLDTSDSGTFSASGGATFTSQCGILIDSSNSHALTASGGASISATAIGIVGSDSVSGGATLSPSPTTGDTPFSDPLAYLTAPSVGACTYSNTSVSGGKTQTLSQGVYCGGIAISGGSTVTLNPGNYILNGGGLAVSGGSTIQGTGIFFYNTGGSSYKGISLSGGCTVVLAAPTSGSYAGILFFQDRSISSGAASSLSGGGSSKYEGTLYFPTTALTYSGGSGAAYTLIVAKTLTLSGGSVVGNNYSSLSGGSPIKSGITLAE
jgi:Flp pilus assembly protein TadG